MNARPPKGATPRDSSQPRPLHHLLVIEDGERHENELFLTKRELGEHVLAAIKAGEYGDEDEVDDLLQEQDEEALAADYPEGENARLPDPEDRIDGIRDWLANHGVDMYTDELYAPVRTSSSTAAAAEGVSAS